MTTTTLSVEGMTCGSCAAHVKKSLSIPGVDRVDVDLANGFAAITHAATVSADSFIAAVTRAGYGATVHIDSPRPAPRSGCCCAAKRSVAHAGTR
jgi:copper chaperone CopZ